MFGAVRARALELDRNVKSYWEADLGDGHVFVYVPAGGFEMGAREGEPFEQPVHHVVLDGYWIGKYPVTMAQFHAFVDESGYQSDAESGEGCWIEDGGHIRYDASWRTPYFASGDDYPVVCVSWNDASAFAVWLGSRLGLPVALPTEAQWEKAARGEDERPYPWGAEPPDGSQANFADGNYARAFPDRRNPSVDVDDGYAHLSPVNAFPSGSSPYGVFDMAGNTIDWLADWFEPTYYAASPKRNPSGPVRHPVRHKFSIPGGWSSNLQRSIRGGAWTDASGQQSLAEGGHSIRSDRRESTDQFSSDDHMSFRLAIDPRRGGPVDSEPENAASMHARASVMEKVGDVEVMFQYRRAPVSGRERRLFGRDVPYGEPWSIASPNPALFSADADVLVEGEALSAGTYAMEIVPSSLHDGSRPWTVIFKSWRGRLGVGDEVLRVQAHAQLEDNSKERVEVFFDARSDRGVIARILWEFVEVHVALSDPRKGRRLDFRDPRRPDAGYPVESATPASVMNGFGKRELSVSYERESSRGRQVFGDLVPFGQPWPVDDTAIALEVRGPLAIAGEHVAAGRYGVQLVPNATNRWTFTLTPLAGQLGAVEEVNAEATVVVTSEPLQRLELYFDSGPDGGESLVIAWGGKFVFLTIDSDVPAR